MLYLYFYSTIPLFDVKTLFFPLIFLVIGLRAGQAQSFEGTLRWKMTTEFTDPAIKQQMNEAMKSMPPEMQSQMAMPTGMTIKIQGGNFLVQMDGSAATLVGDILYRKDKDQSYSVKRAAKTYWVVPKNEASKESTPTFKVTKTRETARVLNYLCTKYVVELSSGGQSTTQFIWASTEFKEIDPKVFSEFQKRQKNGIDYAKEIPGVALKTEIRSPQANATIELVEVKKQKLDGAEFILPADFKETKGMMDGMK